MISTPEALAEQMALLTRSLKDATTEAMSGETGTGEFHQLKQAFNKISLCDIETEAFADMYAQTISYGLFAARVRHAQNLSSRSGAPSSPSQPFNRHTAATGIPATNPFLKHLFNTLIKTDLIPEVNTAIDDLVRVLAEVDLGSFLENFARRTGQEDAAVHFYEIFLAAYDASLRKKRGVYCTPEPVVSYIVRSVDALLKNRFNLPLGLADSAQNPATQQPRVQILDPATGTGTFLYNVVSQIYRNLEETGLTGTENPSQRSNFLSRLFGFELLMAPWAIAHLKLGWQLQNFGYQFPGTPPLGIYLTGTPDSALKKAEAIFAQGGAAGSSENLPVRVILGNPPYSVKSASQDKLLDRLVRDYYYIDGEPLGERNPKNLLDDYVKFIRLGQLLIGQAGSGILAFITNHSYLDCPTFRGMRQNLMRTFTDIYILDLHGNAKKRETGPDGSPDQNVFDIQQGVSVGIFIKESGKHSPASVRHSDLWGTRAGKYEFLKNRDVGSTEWQTLDPQLPFYLFKPQDVNALAEYETGWKITEIMPVHSTGIKTHRDKLVFDFDLASLRRRIERFRDLSVPASEIAEEFDLADSPELRGARKAVAGDKEWESKFTECLYRPFDRRYYYHHPAVVERPRTEVMRHMLAGENLAVLTHRQILGTDYSHWFCSDTAAGHNALDVAKGAIVFPLYLYSDSRHNYIRNQEAEPPYFPQGKIPNLSQKFLRAIGEKLGYLPAPEAIFYYAYALFHSPAYRQRYAEFLKIDFPRLPVTGDSRLFQALSQKGQDLAQLHLMKSHKLSQPAVQYPVSGDNAVTKVSYKPALQRVYINREQYFQGIAPQVWAFKVGGYQVLNKWLKDRLRGNCGLGVGDIDHYQRVAVAVAETVRLMAEIDRLIPRWPLE
ncbi:type ISP restriction/modification enzyme [Kamptonema formosum]|uniref:type ISP restriction/modification enzyme n=1 Tax=Kamptonema formosum TaxID=331992 RepID=UPI000346FB69|nr:type ISP restriction/modification enzyme [Oscillatoria sp. PCC 10802]